MKLESVEKHNVKTIVSISKRAFETDVNVGGAVGDYPPEYDSFSWHEEMRKEEHLFQAVEEDALVRLVDLHMPIIPYVLLDNYQLQVA